MRSRYIALVALSALFLLFLSEGLTLLSGESDLSVYDESDRGLSRAFGSVPDDLEVSTLLTSPSLLIEEDEPERTLLVNIGPQRAYSLTEVHIIRKFMDRGGRVLMADDHGFLNTLAGEMGITFVEGQLYDENFKDTPDLVRVDDVKIGDLSGIVLLNKPSSLLVTEGMGFIRTSESSWVDRNGNGVMDEMTLSQGESPGPRFVGAVTDPGFREKGEGTAIFISDPSMFMNWMIDEEDNMDLFKALLEYLLPDGGKVIFDESTHDADGNMLFLQRGLRLPVMLSTDINMKIVLGTIAAITLFAVAYIHDPPGMKKHVSILDRTGVAEIVDPSIDLDDVPEVRKVLLDRVRLAHGMSMEAFSLLSWEQIKEMLGNDILFEFARTGDLGKEGMDLTALLVEVNGWEKK